MIKHKARVIGALVGVAIAFAPLSSAFAAQHYRGVSSHARFAGHGYGGHYGRGYGWPVFGLAAALVGTAAAIVTAPIAILSAAASRPYYGPAPEYAPAPSRYYDAPPAYYNAPRESPYYRPSDRTYDAPPSGSAYYGPAPRAYYAPPPASGYYDPRDGEAPRQYQYAPQPDYPSGPDSREYYDNGR